MASASAARDGRVLTCPGSLDEPIGLLAQDLIVAWCHAHPDHPPPLQLATATRDALVQRCESALEQRVARALVLRSWSQPAGATEPLVVAVSATPLATVPMVRACRRVRTPAAWAARSASVIDRRAEVLVPQVVGPSWRLDFLVLDADALIPLRALEVDGPHHATRARTDAARDDRVRRDADIEVVRLRP